jgi:hypothetical protein
MSTWFKLLTFELEGIKMFTEPTDEVKPSEDKVLGNLNEEHKALYTYWTYISKRAEMADVEKRYETDPVEKERKAREVNELNLKAYALNCLLWLAIHEDLGTWLKQPAAIRKGWVLVQTTPPKPRSVFMQWPFPFQPPENE